MAFAAFSLAILSGLWAGAPTDRVLSNALISMVLCYVAGWIIGAGIEHTIRERVDAEMATDPRRAKAPAGKERARNRGQRNASAA